MILYKWYTNLLLRKFARYSRPFASIGFIKANSCEYLREKSRKLYLFLNIMWLLIAIFAFFIFAINSLVDKLLLKRPIPEPIAYAFFVGFLSIGALILIPFGFTLNTPANIIGAAIASGALFFLYLLIFFKILFKGEASRVIPASGALIGIFTFILSRVFLKEQLQNAQMAAFFLLILGGILITLELKSNDTRFAREIGSLGNQIKTGFLFVLSLANYKRQNLIPDSDSAEKRRISSAGANLRTNAMFINLQIKLDNAMRFVNQRIGAGARIFFWLCLSALFFAASFVILKYVYLRTSFINAFIWSRIGILIAAFFLLVQKQFRLLIFKKTKEVKHRAGLMLVGNKTLAGIGALLMNFAISKGSVTLISAVAGVQYAFVFLFSIIIFFINPALLAEKVNKKTVIQKISAILIIAAGLALLTMQ